MVQFHALVFISPLSSFQSSNAHSNYPNTKWFLWTQFSPETWTSPFGHRIHGIWVHLPVHSVGYVYRELLCHSMMHTLLDLKGSKSRTFCQILASQDLTNMLVRGWSKVAQMLLRYDLTETVGVMAGNFLLLLILRSVQRIVWQIFNIISSDATSRFLI